MRKANEKQLEDMEITPDQLNPDEKILLLLLKAKNEEPVPRQIYLQKELFLLSQNLDPLARYFEYKPNVQGPYSEAVKNLLDDLELEGLVEESGEEIKLTPLGSEVSDSVYKKASDKILELIEDIKDFLNDLSQEGLLLYIYKSYGWVDSESLEKDNLEKRKEHIAKKLYNKGKISLEKASELAEMPISEFKGLLRG